MFLASRVIVLSQRPARIVAEVGTEFPDVEVGYQHIDAATIHLVTDPGELARRLASRRIRVKRKFP